MSIIRAVGRHVDLASCPNLSFNPLPKSTCVFQGGSEAFPDLDAIKTVRTSRKRRM